MTKLTLKHLLALVTPWAALVAIAAGAVEGPKLPLTPITELSATNEPMPAERCSEVLHGSSFRQPTGGEGGHEFVIVPSSPERDADTIPVYTEFTAELSQPGGVLDQLGIPRTKQVIEFLNGREMRALLATAGASPVAHYWDGSQIVNSMADKSRMVFEVVYPGSEYNHGYYRDDNPLETQLSIILHVVGHNHFAHSSGFTHYRSAQATEVAKSLNAAVKRAYEEAPKEEVEDFYLFMLSMAQYDDYHAAHYNQPEDFAAQTLQDIDLDDLPGKDRSEKAKKKSEILQRGLRRNTENTLSALVQRIQDNNLMPQWKKDIAALIPHTGHYRPALVHTQVMNEGWASIYQEIIMRHMSPRWNTQRHWLHAHSVIEGSVDHIKLQNPYWLGVQGWHNLRNKFLNRPEIAALETEIEKDRAFIEYGDHLIRTMSDYEFLEIALEDSWIQRKKLALTRKATREEAGKLPQPPQDMENPEPVIVVSKDPERIRKSIIESVVGSKTRFKPRLKLRSFNRQGTGEIDIAINDEVGSQIPLQRKTVGAALYSIASSMDQPVSLEATLGTRIKKTREELDEEWGDFWDIWDPLNPTPLPEILPYKDVIGRYRLVVSPSGEMRMFELDTDQEAAPELPPQNPLFSEIEQHLHNYITMLHLQDDDKLDKIASQNPRYQRISMHALEQTLNGMPFLGLVDHVPSAGEAIIEYQNKVEARIMKAFELAMKGKGALLKSGNSMFLQALPGPMSIMFDGEFIQSLQDSATPGPIDLGSIGMSHETVMSQYQFGQNFLASEDNFWRLPTISRVTDLRRNPFDGDLGGELLPTDIGPGDGGWRPGPGQGGGDGEPGDEPGEPGDDPGGKLPGEEGLDPTWVPFPKELYANFIGENVKLPNLQPKSGRTKSKRMRLNRKGRGKNGPILAGQTAANALRLGIGEAAANGENPEDVDPFDLMAGGFSLMRTNDFVYRKANPVKKPDTNAVIVLSRDASGSTMAYTDLYKRFLFDFKTLIEANYKNVKFEYIVFDYDAKRVATEEEFFRIAMGGGTSYHNGVRKMIEVMEDYPAENWDRFPFVIGDLGDYYDGPTEDAYREMIEMASFAGTVKAGWGVDDFTAAMHRLHDEEEYYGFVDMGDQPQGYGIEHLKTLLKNPVDE
jgi:spore cortex formation protein SpoVR/YcgB (stage V sporulation)